MEGGFDVLLAARPSPYLTSACLEELEILSPRSLAFRRVLVKEKMLESIILSKARL